MNQKVHRDYLEVLTQERIEREQRLAQVQHQIDELRREQVGLEAEQAEMRPIEERVARKAGVRVSETAQREESPVSRLIASPRIPAENDSPRPHGDVIEDVLRKARNPMRVQEIIDAVRDLGQPLPDEPKLQYSAIYAALNRRRYTAFEKTDRSEWKLIKSKSRNQSDDTKHQTNEDYKPIVSHKETYVETAESVIKRSGCPVTAGEVADEVIQRNNQPTPNRESLRKVIYKRMCRSRRFRKVSPGRFDLA